MNFFPIEENFLTKFLPEAVTRENWCQNLCIFSLLHAKVSALKLCSGIITKFHF